MLDLIRHPYRVIDGCDVRHFTSIELADDALRGVHGAIVMSNQTGKVLYSGGRWRDDAVRLQ